MGNSGSEGAGFAYDWARQKQQERVEAEQKKKALKKKIDKLTGKNRNPKHH